MASIYDYSTTAGSNTSVGGVSIAEGMAAGNVNNSLRAIMADLAAYIDATDGALLATSGDNVAFAVASTGLSLSAYANGLTISVRANAANTGACTLNLDSVGAKDIKIAGIGGLVDPAANQIRANGVYLLAYRSSNDAFMLLNPSLGTIAALNTTAVGALTGTTLTGATAVVGGDGTATSSAEQLRALGDTIAGVRIETASNGTGRLAFRDTGSGTSPGRIEYDHTVDKMSFVAAGGSATQYVTNSGIMVGTDALIDPTTGTTGCSFASDGLGTFARSADVVLRVKRATDDGTLVQFYQAGSVEGVISVSGDTVTYGSFCGVHWSQGVSGLLPGTILESTDEMCAWPGEVNITLPKVALASEGSRSVYGVYHATDEDGDLLVAGLGALFIRIAPGETVSRGDLIESAGDGMGRAQGNDFITACTVGKVTSGERVREYPDGSYLVPCTLCCG